MAFRGFFWVWLSFLLGMMLMALPLLPWAIWLRPEWLLLVLIYWVIALPHRISAGTAWVLGLLLDGMNGALLGEHALAFLGVTYVAAKLHLQIRVFSIWQQAVIVGGLVAWYLFIIFCIQAMLGHFPQSLLYWLPVFSSMVLWPWVFILLRDWRRRFRIQ